MMTRKTFPIAVKASGTENQSDCGDAEPYALMVLGDSMTPEFNEGEIIIIEPASSAAAGTYILAFHNEEYIFRQLTQSDTGWCLHPLNAAYPDVPIADLSAVKGVITQKSLPGRRSASKIYIG